jgi:CubicO group peptidase (beta-lactamase class C family)
MQPSAREFPIIKAANAQGLLLGPPKPQTLPTPDEWMRRVGTLPLMHQPGAKWMYDLGLDVLGVLIARAAKQSLDVFMRERIFDPLGMKDTAFHVPSEKLVRLATSYMPNAQTGALDCYDDVEHSQWSRPPAFASAAGGLVSTIDDYFAFAQMLLSHGRHAGTRILSRPAVELMTSDQVTLEQRLDAPMFLGADRGWGFGVAVTQRRSDLTGTPGQYGWTGGLGTCWASDPAEGLIGILLSQRAMNSPVAPPLFADFWTSTYQAIA